MGAVAATGDAVLVGSAISAAADGTGDGQDRRHGQDLVGAILVIASLDESDFVFFIKGDTLLVPFLLGDSFL